MTEWRPINSCVGHEASDDGQIRIVIQRPNGRWKTGRSAHPAGYVFKPLIKRYGSVYYAVVRLTLDGARKHRFVHRLVCEAFHGKPPTAEHHAAHWDGDSLNNRLENLRWATPQENINDRERHGRTSRGEHRYNSRLKNTDIPKIRALIAGGHTLRNIGDRFSVAKHVIFDIKRRRSWTHT